MNIYQIDFNAEVTNDEIVNKWFYQLTNTETIGEWKIESVRHLHSCQRIDITLKKGEEGLCMFVFHYIRVKKAAYKISLLNEIENKLKNL